MVDELKKCINVMIVDDEPLNQFALKSIIYKLKYKYKIDVILKNDG